MSRFEFVSTQDINDSLEKLIPSNTRRTTTFAVGVYEDWMKERNVAFPNKQVPSLNELINVDLDKFQQTLAHFVFEIRRRDGKEYPANTIYGIYVWNSAIF